MLLLDGLRNFVVLLLVIETSLNSVNCVGNCTKPNEKTKCCINYHKSNGLCVQCPNGRYGENCSEICPVNMYGELCSKRCNCTPTEECNREYGCLTCPLGFYGENCGLICPEGRYGLFCSKMCQCPTSECDKVYGCSKTESYIETIGLVYWIIPSILAFVVFTTACLYRRFRERKPRNFAAEYIPSNQLEMHGTAEDDLLHNDNTVKKTNNNPLKSGNVVAASYDTSPKERCFSDAEENGNYNTLNLRVFDYEVPIKHKERKKSYSEASSLYIKCPNGKLSPSPDEVNDTLIPSIRFTRNTDKSMQRKIEMHPTMKKIDVENEQCEENHECSSKAFEDVYDKATFEDTKIFPPRQIFLKELSSRLINQMT